jgi:hypothetical protein
VFLLNRFRPLEGLDHQAVIKFKTERSEEDLCIGDDSSQLVPLLKEVHQYSFDQRPDYEKIKTYLNTIIEKDSDIIEDN